jgi:hypothetical protein
MTNIDMPDSLMSIGTKAFFNCFGLTSVTMPKNVTSVADFAFAYCNDLTAIYFTGNAPTASGNAFYGDETTIYYASGTAGWGTNFCGLPTATWNP